MKPFELGTKVAPEYSAHYEDAYKNGDSRWREVCRMFTVGAKNEQGGKARGRPRKKCQRLADGEGTNKGSSVVPTVSSGTNNNVRREDLP